MIIAEELSKQYAGKKALSGLSFTVSHDAVLGFIGPNGAGKSTAMRILCGIMPPSSGKVVIDGFSMKTNPVEAKKNLGYLPENAPLYGGMNVRTFLRFCGEMRGFTGKKLDLAVGRVMEICRLEEVRFEETEALSKGFRRRTCLAQTLLHSPKNLVLDEPTDGLDPDQKKEIRSLIGDLKGETALIVSTHILEEVDAVCDRVLAIRHGQKVFDGTTAEFRALAPETNVIILRTTGGNPSLLASVSGAEKPEIHTDGDQTEIRIRPVTGTREELLADLMNRAASSGCKVLSCRLPEVRLSDIFTKLGSEVQP